VHLYYTVFAEEVDTGTISSGLSKLLRIDTIHTQFEFERSTMTMTTMTTMTASSTPTQPQPPRVARQATSAVKLLLSCLIFAALLATHTLSNQQGDALDQAATGVAGDGAMKHSRLRGVNTQSNTNRNLAGVALSIAGGGGSSNAGAITSYIGANKAFGSGNGGGQSSSNTFSVGNTGAAYANAGGKTINNSTANATSADQAVAEANATSINEFKSYGVALYYEDGGFGGYYGLGNAYGYGFGYGYGDAPASSKGTGFGSETSYGGGLAYLGEVGALAQGSNLAKGSGTGGGRKPSGYGSFGGGGGGGGDQYGGSFAAFGPRFNDSAYGLPELPGALSALTRPNRTVVDNQPNGTDGGFNQTDGTTIDEINNP
jgi:hypothetical protein